MSRIVEPLSDEALIEIRRRCESASPGPWISMVEGRDGVAANCIMTGGERERRMVLEGAFLADQDFIAAARQDIPLLLDEIARLRAQLPAEEGGPAEIVDFEIQPGEIYEDAADHPCLCIGSSVEDDQLWGISLIDGSYPRACSITYSHPQKMSAAEAWEAKRKYQRIAKA